MSKLSKDAVLKIATVAYQSIMRDIDVAPEFEALDSTTFGQSQKQYEAGLEDADPSFTGLFSRAEQIALYALRGTKVAVEFHPEGTGAGTPKWTGTILFLGLSNKATVGQLLELGLKFKGTLTMGTN